MLHFVEEAVEKAHVDPREWELALRFTLDGEHAHQRCGKRNCRKKQRCMLVYESGRSSRCGGGLSEEALVRACELVLFAWLVDGRVYLAMKEKQALEAPEG